MTRVAGSAGLTAGAYHLWQRPEIREASAGRSFLKAKPLAKHETKSGRVGRFGRFASLLEDSCADLVKKQNKQAGSFWSSTWYDSCDESFDVVDLHVTPGAFCSLRCAPGDQ